MCEIALGLRQQIDLEGKKNVVEDATALFRGSKHRISLRILLDKLLLRRKSDPTTVNSFSVISKISRRSAVDALATDSTSNSNGTFYHPRPQGSRNSEAMTSTECTKTSPRRIHATYKLRTTNSAHNTHSTTLPSTPFHSSTFRPCIKSAIRHEIISQHGIHSRITSLPEKPTKSRHSNAQRRIDTRSHRRYPIERAQRSPPLPSTISPRSLLLLPRFPGFPIASRVREPRDLLGITEGRKLERASRKRRSTSAFRVVDIVGRAVLGVRNVSIR